MPTPASGDSLFSAFHEHVAQTSPFPNGLEVAKGAGCRIIDSAGRSYLDFIAGIAVLNVGHAHPRVVHAVQEQVALYAHTMVYGEHVQRPQVELAEEIASVAPPGLETTYFLSTGAEANDAALKMAVKLTGRSRVAAFRKAYHGDTIGALACFGEERFRTSFSPLLCATDFLQFGSFEDLERINRETAAVLVEPVQGEAGIHPPPEGWLRALRERCSQVGALLIFDEVQTGFGRTGEWFASILYNVVPDAVTMAKGMGMGMPLAGLLSSRDLLYRFAADPPFSHITTFGGHPVSCAAGLAGMRVIREENLLEKTRERGAFLREQFCRASGLHPALVQEVRGVGLMLGVQMCDEKTARTAVIRCKELGLIVETTLLDERVIRFSPPLVVTHDECEEAVSLFSQVLQELS